MNSNSLQRLKKYLSFFIKTHSSRMFCQVSWVKCVLLLKRNVTVRDDVSHFRLHQNGRSHANETLMARNFHFINEVIWLGAKPTVHMDASKQLCNSIYFVIWVHCFVYFDSGQHMYASKCEVLTWFAKSGSRIRRIPSLWTSMQNRAFFVRKGGVVVLSRAINSQTNYNAKSWPIWSAGKCCCCWLKSIIHVDADDLCVCGARSPLMGCRTWPLFLCQLECVSSQRCSSCSISVRAATQNISWKASAGNAIRWIFQRFDLHRKMATVYDYNAACHRATYIAR